MGVSGRPEVLAGFLRRLDFFDPKSFETDFDERLILQKTIYLMEEWGKIPFGYTFRWYYHGPYSSGLARDAFPATRLYNSSPRRKFVDPSVNQRLERMEAWFKSQPKSPSWFELLGSALYLFRGGSNLDEAIPKLTAKIPGITPAMVRDAWGIVSGPAPTGNPRRTG
jgi:hypothetical protein